MMKFYVDSIQFDFTDDEQEVPVTFQELITEEAHGLWDAEDEDSLVDVITEEMGFCVNSIAYHVAVPNVEYDVPVGLVAH